MQSMVFLLASLVSVVTADGWPGFKEEESPASSFRDNSFAVAMQDVDADGDLDIFITNSGTPNRLYINTDGLGNFEEQTNERGLDFTGESRGAAFADVNGDGLVDLYVTTASGPNHLYISQRDQFQAGSIVFKDQSATAGVDDMGVGQGACFADVDNDGDLDLFVANGAESNNLYLNDGKGIFTNFTQKAGLMSTKGGFGCTFGDFDGDGDLDLYLSNTGVLNNLYINNGDGTFQDNTQQAGVAANDGQGRAVSFADLNGDGLLDLFMVGPLMANILYINNGDGTFKDNTGDAGLLSLFSSAQGMNIADVDGDGDLDIYVSDIGTTGVMYQNDGTGHFKDVTTAAGLDYHLNGQGVAFGDIDADGDLDMYVCNWPGLIPHAPAFPFKENKLFINQLAELGGQNQYLKVRPLDEKGSATLLGTQVRLFEAGTSNPVGVRMQIDGGSAFCGQNAYDAYFGLSNSAVDKVDIEMMCGGKESTKVEGVTLNQVVKAKCTRSKGGSYLYI